MRSPGEAKELFQQYLALNPDLQTSTAHIMAAFAVAPYVTNATLYELLGRRAGQTFRRERAFFWWNAFALSGLAKHWPWFVKRRNGGEPMNKLLFALRRRISRKRWLLLSRRLGKEELNPSIYTKRTGQGNIWTKGGTWARSSTFTTLLIHKQHLPPRPKWLRWQEKLGDEGVRQIERELMNVIDPDVMLAPEARTYACDYVRARVPLLVGGYRLGRLMSAKHLPWFFQAKVPYDGTTWRHRRRPANQLLKGDVRRWEW
jgi:hypothetical protein